MSVLAIVRPDGWNLPLLVHVLGAMILVGALVLAATSLAAASRSNSPAMARMSFRSLLWAALPAWIVMRVGAEWVASEEGLVASEDGLTGDAVPDWIEMGYITAEPTFLLLIIATVLAGIGARRAARPDGSAAGVDRVATVLVSIALVAYVFAIWVMTTKPG